MNFKFYESRLISDSLVPCEYFDEMRNEIESYDREWTPWPEAHLKEFGSWDIVPFVGFGKTVESNCRRFPLTWSFIRSIKGVKLAILSKMEPKTKLIPHQGWGVHSNGVIRCHFGVRVPSGCFVAVFDEPDASDIEVRKQVEGQWLAFDDSKHHMAANPSNEERIVLIVDVERPNYIKPGSAKGDMTEELRAFISRFD